MIKLKEILDKLNEFGPGSYSGERTFQGTGNFGVSGKNQLFITNPATQAIQDQEQEEINQNIKDQQFTLGKFMASNAGPLGPNEPEKFDNRGVGSNPQSAASNSLVRVSRDPYGTNSEENEEDEEKENNNNSLVQERTGTDQFYSYLKGYPRENALEKPEQFVPSDHEAEREKQLQDEEESFWSSKDILVNKKNFLNTEPNEDTPFMGYSVSSIVLPKNYIPADQDAAFRNRLKEYIKEEIKLILS